MNRLKRLNPSAPILTGLLLLTGTLRLVNLAGSPTRLDDEGTYVAQAYAISEWGELAHYTYWYDHPPAGWLQLAVWNMFVGNDFGGSAVVAGRYLMAFVAVITAALLWTLARRVGLPRWAAAAAVTILAVSPLAISLSRSVYLDNLAIAWLLGALVLVCSPRHRLSAIFGAAACFGICVLTKETLILFVPMVAWLVWIKTAPATRRYALTVFGAVFGVVVSTYVLMAVVRGELLPGPGHVSLWEGIKFQLWQREGSGALSDPQSLKRHTIDEWLALDPTLPLLAAPVALTGLLIERIRPFAVGLMILLVTIVRPGYLPVPFVIAALPFMALVVAGIGEVGVDRLRRATKAPSVQSRYLRTAAVASTVLVASVVVSLWVPSYHTVLADDTDASMRQAQQWISQNVPKRDRLIVDDALWVDLVDDNRDRRNVIWSYKVDTDEQVQNWAPRGWADYEWVVSTPSMRANMPDQGVLTDAMTHARPVATFGSGGKRVDVLRVDTGSAASKPATPALPVFGEQVASRLDPASNPDALAALQSRTVDQRVLATLSVLVSMQPVVLEGFSSTAAEEIAGTPQREFTLAGAPGQLSALAAFLQRQDGPFAVESAEIAGDKIRVRFPARATDVGLGDNPIGPPDGSAVVRVADMRRAAPADHVEFVRIDGGAAGSVRSDAGQKPAPYRTMPAGTYVMLTVGDRAGAPKMRQAFTVKPGGTYTLALFSAAETSELAAQLAPDTAPPGPAVRLLHAAGVAGSVRLALTPAGGEPTVLADNAQYGLITGYAPLAAGAYDATVTANGREWRLPVQLAGDGPTTLMLTDGPDGPLLQQTRDVPDAAAPLDPPGLTMPAANSAPDKTPTQAVYSATSRAKFIPLVLCAVVIAGVAIAIMKSAGRQR